MLSKRQWHKLIAAAMLAAVVPAVIYIQLSWRHDTSTHLMAHALGLAPNFLAGIGVPFAILLLDPDYETQKRRRFWYYNFVGFLLLLIHEYERFTVNYAFDWQDLAVSAAGILLADGLYYGVIAKNRN